MKRSCLNIVFLLLVSIVYSQVDTAYNDDGSIYSIGEIRSGNKVGIWYSDFREGEFYSKTTYLMFNRYIYEFYDNNAHLQEIYKSKKLCVLVNVDNNQKYLKRKILGIEKSDSAKGVYGKAYTYYPDGTISSKVKLRDGYWDGRLKVYYPNGSLGNIIHFNKNINHGGFKAFYDNGQLMVKGKYKNDARIGKWYEYYSNGQIKATGKYCTDIKPIVVTMENQMQLLNKYPYLENEVKYIGIVLDFKSGTWLYYNEQGNIIKEEYYSQGNLIETKEY
ncbi:MAG: hypothetical protein JXR36_14595 [Bacteroidales bacterium]|nr:hypothetical protein [Bacteroidales bacterium]